MKIAVSPSPRLYSTRRLVNVLLDSQRARTAAQDQLQLANLAGAQ